MKEIKKCVMKYFPGCMAWKGKQHSLHLRLRSKVDLTDGSKIAPWATKTFTQAKQVQEYASGSKVVFTRRSTLDGEMNDIYMHTGILLRVGGKEYIVELQKTDGKTMTIMTDWDNIDNMGEVKIDNCYLIHSNVRINDILYRLSRIIGVPVQYDAT